MKDEIHCLGHYSPKNDRCPSCKRDNYNFNCDDFEPMQVHKFKIQRFKVVPNHKSQLEKFKDRYPTWCLEEALK